MTIYNHDDVHNEQYKIGRGSRSVYHMRMHVNLKLGRDKNRYFTLIKQSIASNIMIPLCISDISSPQPKSQCSEAPDVFLTLLPLII